MADGLRGLAAIAIVVVHVHVFTGGAGGDSLVDRLVIRLDVVLPLFFALSAFLLYRPLIAHRGGGPPAPSLARFGRGRFLRIYPLYWVVLTVLAIVPGLAGVFSDEWWRFYTLIASAEPTYSASECVGEEFSCGLPQTWSLVAEITFYALLPAFAALTNRLARGRTTAVWVRNELILIFAIVGTVVALSSLGMRDEPVWRFTFFGSALWFAVGLVLALGSVSGLARAPFRAIGALAGRPGLAWLAAGAVYAALALSLEPVPFIVANESTPEYLLSHLGFALICLLAMIPVLLGNPNLGWPRRLMARPWALWLGALSYGIYLWHVTIAYRLGVGGGEGGFWIVLVMTFALTIPLAALTYYLVELPSHAMIKRRIPGLRRRRGQRRR